MAEIAFAKSQTTVVSIMVSKRLQGDAVPTRKGHHLSRLKRLELDGVHHTVGLMYKETGFPCVLAYF